MYVKGILELRNWGLALQIDCEDFPMFEITVQVGPFQLWIGG